MLAMAVQAVKPSFNVVVCSNHLLKHRPSTWGENSALNPLGMDIGDYICECGDQVTDVWNCCACVVAEAETSSSDTGHVCPHPDCMQLVVQASCNPFCLQSRPLLYSLIVTPGTANC